MNVKQDPLHSLRLDSIRLWDARVERGKAIEVSAGDVDAQMKIEPTRDKARVQYMVNYSCVFNNRHGERMADIEVAYLLTYKTPDSTILTQEDLERFSKSVVMQVTPFQREFLASVSNRMGLPPFYLPIMRLDELADDADSLAPGEA